MTWPADLAGLTAADVMHRHLTTLSADATLGELREYFAASASRRLALVERDGLYVGSIDADRFPEDADPASPVADHATLPPTVAPGAPATDARDTALREPSRRLPVVDEAGKLVGIVAITRGLDGFCGAAGDG